MKLESLIRAERNQKFIDSIESDGFKVEEVSGFLDKPYYFIGVLKKNPSYSQDWLFTASDIEDLKMKWEIFILGKQDKYDGN